MTEERLRLDKWLWYAWFFKSRSLAQKLCETGRLRINGQVVRKTHQTLKPGDVLTFPKGRDIRVIRVVAGRERGTGRPTKADRRAIDRLHGDEEI